MEKPLPILLVEDDPVLGPVTADLLSAHGYETILAASIEQALSRLAQPNHIKAILLDLQLGRERGEMLIEKLDCLGLGIPPVVILSALPVPQLQQAAQSLHAAGFLEKPCAAQKMVRTLELVLG